MKIKKGPKPGYKVGVTNELKLLKFIKKVDPKLHDLIKSNPKKTP